MVFPCVVVCLGFDQELFCAWKCDSLHTDPIEGGGRGAAAGRHEEGERQIEGFYQQPTEVCPCCM
jgi:hypothetical protein